MDLVLDWQRTESINKPPSTLLPSLPTCSNDHLVMDGTDSANLSSAANGYFVRNPCVTQATLV